MITISAIAADNSLNDSSSMFILSGFSVGDLITVRGFRGSGSPEDYIPSPNNVTDAEILSLTASKMVVDAELADQAAGDDVVISRDFNITYPVDVDNTRWSIWSISQAAILKHNKTWPRADGAEIVGLDPDLVPLLEVQLPQPAYDTATQRLERADPVTDVAANTHTHGWNIVARSQDEIDAEAEREQAKALYAALKAHSGTADERATRLENVVAYLLKDMYGAS